MNIPIIDYYNKIILKNIKILSPVYTTYSLSLKVYTETGEKQIVRVVPLCSYYSRDKDLVEKISVFKSKTIEGSSGYLILGGDAGLRIPSLKKELPFMWVDESKKTVLPKKVRNFVDEIEMVMVA